MTDRDFALHELVHRVQVRVFKRAVGVVLDKLCFLLNSFDRSYTVRFSYSVFSIQKSPEYSNAIETKPSSSITAVTGPSFLPDPSFACVLVWSVRMPVVAVAGAAGSTCAHTGCATATPRGSTTAALVAARAVTRSARTSTRCMPQRENLPVKHTTQDKAVRVGFRRS